MPLLFVYGTLKRGERNHRLLRGGQFVATVVTAPLYRLYDLGSHPGLIEIESEGDSIKGELWDVGDCLLGELDDFEGVPSLFRRGVIEILDQSDQVEAYFWNRALLPAARRIGHWPLPDVDPSSPSLF